MNLAALNQSNCRYVESMASHRGSRHSLNHSMRPLKKNAVLLQNSSHIDKKDSQSPPRLLGNDYFGSPPTQFQSTEGNPGLNLLGKNIVEESFLKTHNDRHNPLTDESATGSKGASIEASKS